MTPRFWGTVASVLQVFALAVALTAAVYTTLMGLFGFLG